MFRKFGAKSKFGTQARSPPDASADWLGVKNPCQWSERTGVIQPNLISYNPVILVLAEPTPSRGRLTIHFLGKDVNASLQSGTIKQVGNRLCQQNNNDNTRSLIPNVVVVVSV